MKKKNIIHLNFIRSLSDVLRVKPQDLEKALYIQVSLDGTGVLKLDPLDLHITAERYLYLTLCRVKYVTLLND